ncbi:SDR family NAD(P)-dependent oxidoreductase [Sphingomonas sp.]|uniref:SDR family NAD(P)-dependent oxidoreductase n=1 Tax=Sphingomonas sp. TaxID=28214 RepID=UPI003CC65930
MGAETTSTEVMQGVDLSGKLALVTGGSSGIGYETARALLAAGADVCIGARDRTKLEAAAERLGEGAQGSVFAYPLDLSELDSVDAFADDVLALDRPIDLLIANAGIMACPLERNSRGIEMQLATNYIGHAALISRLAAAVRSAARARVVILTSSGHHFSGIRDDLNFENESYDKWTAYGQSKTASALLALKVHDVLSPHGVTALAVHPGFIQTDLMRYLSKEDYVAMQSRTDIVLPTKRTYKTVEQGAATTLWAATAPELAGRSAYLEDCSIAQPAAVRDTLHGTMPWVTDRAAGEALWAKAEQLAGRPLPLA